ncbi:hypothetical protein [Candidatus Solincola tengchongensis]|uniref:hypothetical protein n=1 Tax=Candidatus Solincola tengchongensis TaxID=2900693 RepID=UPI00257A6B61|nr:hypothetical protein [Candidatus Solincola tengchongensis]
MEVRFPAFRAKAEEVLAGVSGLDGEEDYRRLLCGDCPFYHHGEKENEECGSYRILRKLLEAGALDLGNAIKALS